MAATEPPASHHRLTLVPTPIGNLADITLRALDTLRRADLIAAEDTRHSRVLLDHYGITTPLQRLDAHTIAQRARPLLLAHAHVAYITDAGTPGISDPGAELVRLALSLGVSVEVLPGASAFVPALVLAGLPLQRFTFEGFLPRKGRLRRARLDAIANRDHPSALYESPLRLLDTLEELRACCGEERAGAVVRELSKRFEEVVRGPLSDLVAHFGAHPARGEIVVVVGPAVPVADAEGASLHAAPLRADERARELVASGLWGKGLRAALEAEGVARVAAYELAVRYGRKPG
jgi:16S rRNA (cytidine1402-2'-O)-methyltransferase